MARSAVLVVLVSVAAAPPPDVAGPELKCRRSVQLPGYPEDELVLLIDGELIRPGPGQTLEEHLAERDDIGADDIDAVEVTCWHPERNAFGLGAGLPVVRVRTKSLVSSTRAPLEALIRAQEAYAAEHGDHAGALLDLLAYGLPRDLEIDFAASEKGWEASTADGPVAYHCTASFRATGERAPGVVEEGRGSAEEAPEAVHGPGRARIACDTRDELEIQVLREAFEAHGSGRPPARRAPPRNWRGRASRARIRRTSHFASRPPAVVAGPPRGTGSGGRMKRRAFLRLGASAATAPVVLSLAPRPGRAHGRIGRSHHAAELRLNANENPLGLSDAAREAAVEALDLANRYPSGARGPLLDALARKHDVGEESIVLGNGSTEMIQVAVQSLAEPGYRIVTADPTFDDVGRYAGPSRVEVVKLPLTADWQHDLKAMEAAARGVPGPVLLYVCNPNNPTGTLTSCDDVEALVGRLPENVHVLIDEAYFEYVEDPGYRSFDRVAAEHPRVVVIRTFSKVHGMAGMRLGYAIAHPDTVGRLAHFTADNAADQLVLAAARASLADEAHVGRSVERNREAKRRLYAHLEALEVEYIPSEASFVMHRIRGDLGDYIDRMREEGIRVGRPFPPLLGYNRLSLALPDDMDRFGGVLREFRRRGWV